MSARQKMEQMREDRDDWRDTARAHAQRITQLQAEVLRLREAMDSVMVGGNHLVTLLPKNVLSPETDPLKALEIMGAGPEYDAWCCWRSIMLARDARDGGDNAA